MYYARCQNIISSLISFWQLLHRYLSAVLSLRHGSRGIGRALGLPWQKSSNSILTKNLFGGNFWKSLCVSSGLMFHRSISKTLSSPMNAVLKEILNISELPVTLISLKTIIIFPNKWTGFPYIGKSILMSLSLSYVLTWLVSFETNLLSYNLMFSNPLTRYI